ncbi:MAG: hypothetical protein AAFW47_03750 [Pseudomonadota bacterium]
MFKKLVLAAGVLGATLAFQAPAQAEWRVGVHFGGPSYSDHAHYGKRAVKVHKKHHKGHRHYSRLTNRELRYLMRERGFHRIRFHGRYDGIAKLTAIGPRGNLGKFRVSTRSGKILSGRIIRHNVYDRGFRRHHRHGHGFHSGFVINF